MSKKILGLDLGTNSIGWALVEQDFENKQGNILGMGSRIIPMSQDILGEFGKGNSVSQTAERTGYRGVRRLRERHLLRRERLHRVLNILDFLPEHYANQIDFENRLGKFFEDSEPKLVYHKNNFIFKKSFEEMLEDFRKHHLFLNNRGELALIPYDWAIYYLRKKALTQKIGKEELAWIILNFNQKRGYYQLRGEDEEEIPNKLVEFYSLQIVDVKADEKPNNKGETWYSLVLENNWVYRRSSKTTLDDWKDKTRDFIVTTDLNDDGTIKLDKEGLEKRSFRSPKEDDWGLRKKKTEQEIEQTKKTVGEYIYDALLKDPKQKINGKLVRTIERKFYKEELKEILEKQIELQPELFTEDLYNNCVRELYRNNEAHRLNLSKRGFLHLFLEDIIFYQRPLKSKKSSIGNCSFEYREYKKHKSDEKGNKIRDKNDKFVFEIDENGKEIKIKEYLKAIPKTNPYYQEFRVWKWLSDLKIYRNDDDTEITSEFLKSKEDIENLFEFLMSQKDVDHKDVFKYFFKDLKGKAQTEKIALYRWNYVFDSEKGESKTYPMNETGYEIKRRLDKVFDVPSNFLTRDIEQKLWHIIYSVKDKKEFEQALNSFAVKHNLDKESFVENFKKHPPYPSEFGAFSEKAIKKLLPLMRIGKYWNWENIEDQTKSKIGNIITGEVDEEIKITVREKAEKHKLENENDFQGLSEWLAKYIVYDRHSEANSAGKWNSIQDLDKYLRDFKQHSLRNPIVEQVVTETLRVVKDIWQHFGQGTKDFFDEIHIELGREMKNTAEDRKRMTDIVTENENTNLRIKALLTELLNDDEVENVRPYSPMQQEALKIYEEGVLNSGIEIPEYVSTTIKKFNESDEKKRPTSSEINRYKLWLEQKYRSPYTGQIIPLNKLFTTEYEIEHIIPQSRYFDDSFSNKVICESAVNKLKDNQLGLEFIKNNFGQKVELGLGKEVLIFTEVQYNDFIKENYSKNRSKRNKLLLEDIPEKMVERQLNDTRYISKYVSNLLSNIVRIDDDKSKKLITNAEILANKETDKTKAEKIREKAKSEANDNGVNSKNIIPGNGKITNELKQDWGLNDVWNDLVLPRFERMNQITNSTRFTIYNEKHQKNLPTVPFEYSKGFQKKRIDHRHHALDALIIACATRDHVNLLNNQSAKSEKKRYDLQRKLRKMVDVEYDDAKTGKRIKREIPKNFLKPWDTFTQDTRDVLQKTVVSFKQNLRVINKATNKYEKWVDKNGVKKKEMVEQKGVNWAIRKSMHKETVSGKIDLPRIKVPKGKILTATRKSIDHSFNLKTIESITDTGIQKILRNYLLSKESNSEIAFSPEGIEDMNKNIKKFNDGKQHQPIYKVRIFELGSKFSLGNKGNRKDKYVEAAKGTNLFFAIYLDEKGKRNYATIPLNEVIERQKQGLSSVPEINEKGDNLLFSLSPNDLVYVPNNDESDAINFDNLSTEQIGRIYKMVSSSGSQCFFVKYEVATSIVNKMEFSALNKMEKSIHNIMIKELCTKLKVDRLGNITLYRNTPLNQYPLQGDTNQSNIASEPAVLYKPKLSFYTDHAEQNDAEAKYNASLTMYERMKQTLGLIRSIYGDQSVSPDFPGRFTIKKLDI